MTKKDKITYESEEAAETKLSDKKLKKLKQQLKVCQQEKTDYLTGWQREKADFINYRRRQEELVKSLKEFTFQEVINSILPVLDGLNSAAKFEKMDLENLQQGIIQLNRQLISILEPYGLKEIKALGEKFDPARHEVIEQLESDQPAGTIIEEIQKGYFLNNKVLRYAKVKTAK